MMEVKRILWPTDLSGIAEKALDYVTSLSEKYGSEVHVLYVIEQLSHHEPWYGEFEKTHAEKIQDWEQKTAEKRLHEICEKFLKGCPLYVKHTAVGDPAQEILRFIEKEKVDLVVMASHGRKGHFRFGGVAEKVIRNASVPVVIIPVELSK
jgi:nucleotide-binding universal stress UspA family protein